ncbi:GTP cyclohydrolase 1 type 2/Nif3 [Podospora fimiseda]|uniref:ATP phosphoribosyltransferase n=1 Tax=Podospora fimiseda TaxID=252190 RepID=A0AAN7BJI1_9PEZI|nr:GTP cyclohydrolase 1 type 2/Nif3 [Podospora fimiseda]
MASLIRYKLVFYVPPTALKACKTAIFAAGAGRYPGPGNYTECCFTTLGRGQFRPGDTANPHIGQLKTLQFVDEVKVEILCVGEETARDAVAALKKSHPYEEPAYEVYKLEDF